MSAFTRVPGLSSWSRSRSGEIEHDAAADFVGILIAAIAQDHDAELAAWHHPDIGRCVVETTVLLDDDRLVSERDFPGQRLLIAPTDGHDALLSQDHRLSQRALDRQLPEIGGEKDGHVARRGVHLPRSRPVIVALLTARLSDRRAVVGVALHRKVPAGKLSART